MKARKSPLIKPKDVDPPYHIVITRRNQVLIRFLKIRAVVNDREIYWLPTDRSVRITIQQNHPRVVITDGFHVAKPLELVYHHLDTYYFKVVCAIDNMQLIAGSVLLLVLYIVGFLSGLWIIKLASFLPILYFLFLYYVNRKDFLQITPV